VKLKEIFFGLGLRPRTREYSFDIERLHLPKEGDIDVALWRHPSAVRRQRKGSGFHLSQREVDVLRTFLNPGDVAIDIGAHTGDSTLPIALAVGKAGTVFALEPNIHAFKVLLANVALNTTRTTIIPLNIAATPEDGTYEFEYSDAGFCNGGLHQGISAWKHAHFFKLAVTGRNVPTYLASNFPSEATRIRYIKIDTEGFDRQVAASMRSMLAEQRPFHKTEIYTHSPQAEREGYYRDLRDLGYQLFRIEDEDEDYRSHPLRQDELMKWSHFDMFAVPESS
jgi:FkbM family methyltransferase